MAKTDFLFMHPSFFKGAGKILDISGKQYKYKASESSEELDAQLMLSDWEMVGYDMVEAMDEFEKKSK